ncbi:TetR/AcrR family transcriptional regulator [Actinomadura napierensis]|uniref:TetR/AcrR family transcriptional regulator n=1 Tax=Actinomadura napierensis TaxID=267854 RepID=A0ABN2YVJ7_9ACTN
MTGAGPSVRRGAGRPTREQAEARNEELLDTALDLFLEHGYETVTMEMIAARVGMTKRTIYARHSDKASLFLAAVLRAIERQALPREALEALDDGDLAGTLEAVARLRIDQVMTPDGLRLQRIINTEGYRFPEIFVAGYELSTARVVEFVAGVLDRAAARGRIAPTDSDQAARAFMSMVVGGQVRAIVAGRPPTPEQIEKRVGFTVRLLLDGLRPR